MLISIVITSYNHCRYLRSAIDSALNQTYRPIEVIVVDDGSTDGSQDVIASYGKSLQAILKGNGGHASALNTGFEASRGEYICPLDSDDLFASDKIEQVVQAARGNPDALLILHRLQTIDANGDPRGSPWPLKMSNGPIVESIAQAGGWWPRPTTSGLVFARRYLSKVLPMPTGPRIWPDTYLAPPAALLAPVVGLPATLGFYRLHGDNTILKYFPKARNRSEARQIAQSRVEQLLMEHDLLVDCMRRLQVAPHAITIDHHPEYQRAVRATGGPVPLMRILSVIAQCKTMNAVMKVREVARMALNRP